MITKKTKKKKKNSPLASQEFASESSYYRGSDIDEPFDAEISDIRKVDFDGDSKWVLDLVDCEKSIVLNKTNGKTISDELGDEMDSWPGQFVHVFTEKRRNPQTGKIGPAISVCGANSDDDELPFDVDAVD